MKMLLMILMASLPFYFVESDATDFNPGNDLCENKLAKNVYRITVNLRRTGPGKWKMSYKVKNLGNSSTEPLFRMKHEMGDCDGLDLHRITGLMKGGFEAKSAHNIELKPIENKFEPLAFHERTGRNIVIKENGSMALKTRKYYGTAMTNRVLRDGEILRLRMSGHQLNTLGVTTLSPESISYPAFTESLESGIWGYNVYQKEIFIGCNITKTNYGVSTAYIKEGDIWGIAIRPGGTLHFFHNGHDLGPAATNVPDKVYGYVEIYGAGGAYILNKKYKDPEDFLRN